MQFKRNQCSMLAIERHETGEASLLSRMNERGATDSLE
jgi:hypothetical protein